jgi:choline dehydrogenase-like flavoprotein
MTGRKFAVDDGNVVVVIGSGAGGGTLSNELAQRGIDVVCLEAGGRLDLSDIVNNEAEMFGRITWLDQRIGTGANIPEFPSWTCKTVGGTTVHWTAVCPRFQAHEFKPLSTYGKLSDADFIDWPLTLAELEPFYEKAERKMGVTGANGLPHLPASNNCKVMMAGARKIGYQAITGGAPMAINSVERDGRPSCQQLGFCTTGCAIGAKWSTLYTEIPKAEKTGHFELREKSMAVRIEHDSEGRITGVSYLASAGTLLTQKAKAVCVAANAVETTRLLLNSKSTLYPEGLGNRRGLVGRHYMRQFTNMVMSEMPGAVNFHRGTQVGGLIRDEARHDPRRGFVGGYVIAPVPLSPENLAANIMPGQWGEEFAAVMSEYTKFAGLIMIGEDPPQRSNRITLHPDLKDQYGLPVPVVHYEEHPNTVAMRAHAFDAGRRIHGALGAKRTFEVKSIPAGHNLGACRMSASDKTGVCDRWGRVFGMPNLFVSDGSQFPSSAAEMPTLTIVSLAIRQAEYLAAQLKRLG